MSERDEDVVESEVETPAAKPNTDEPEATDAESADAQPVDVDAPPEAEVIELVPEPTEADRLREQLEAAQARLRTVSKAYTDLQGEMTNFRERQKLLGKTQAERASFDAVAAFFDPVQNLERSLSTASDDPESLVPGLKLVQQQFAAALKKLGLEVVPGVGAPFDPKMHEALAVTPVTDKEQDGKVLMVHQGGYAVKGKVLMAAQVVIGKFEEAES